MRRRASPLHALLVPAPPPGALKGVAAGAAIYIRPHDPVIWTLPRVAPSMCAARAAGANGAGPASLEHARSRKRRRRRRYRHGDDRQCVPDRPMISPGEAAECGGERLVNMSLHLQGSSAVTPGPPGLPVATAEAAVTALYQAHALGLIRLAHVMLGDRASAEDVVQEAFCGLYRRWFALADAGSAIAYVRSSVLNGCRSVLRRQSRARDRADDQQAAPL